MDHASSFFQRRPPQWDPLGLAPRVPSTDGILCSWWRYEDHFWIMRRYHAASGFEPHEVDNGGITFDEVREGCWCPAARLVDMDTNGVAASLCFPNYPRFAGQLFLNGKDKELSLVCVEAYNNWMVEDCTGNSGGRLIPLCVAPLWDVELAAPRFDGMRRGQFEPLRSQSTLHGLDCRVFTRATGIPSSRRAKKPRRSSACTSDRARRWCSRAQTRLRPFRGH